MMMTTAEKKKMRVDQQYETRTLLPGQPVPASLKDALQKALDEVEAEEALAGAAPAITGAKVMSM